MKKTLLFVFSILMALSFTGAAQADLLWSADFEEPDYVDGYLTGQQGWWDYNATWTAGYVLTSAGSKMVQMGGNTGYAQRILTPWCTADTTADSAYEISLTIRPGAGTQCGNIGIYDNGQAVPVWVKFVGGAITLNDVDTGFDYTAGTTYELDIIWDDANELIAVKVNGNYIAQNVSTGGSYSGLGYMYFYGGGDNGTYAYSNYTFFDNVEFSSLATADAPAFSPAGPEISGPTDVTITCGTAGATIYYTTDGSEPSATNGNVVASGGIVSVDDLTTLKAVAGGTGFLNSITSKMTYHTGVLWSCDFNAPDYTIGYITWQQGWWHYNSSWNMGWIYPNAGGQWGQLGGSNGYPHLVLSPWVDNESESDMYFRTALTIVPGNGNDSAHFIIYNDSQNDTARVKFDGTTGIISVGSGGAASDAYADTGATFTPGEEYLLVIDCNYNTQTFSVKLDDTWIETDFPTGRTSDGAGYMYLNAGGNGGTYIDGVYTYIDDVVVSTKASVAAPEFTPGGSYISGPTDITISCDTAGATIYYTVDGTTPTTASSVYSGAVSVDDGVTLTAIATASGLINSGPSSITFAVPASYDEPNSIEFGTAVVDGDISDWSTAAWTTLDEDYDFQTPTDIAEAAFAVRWQADKLYVAVKVRDTAHSFSDSNIGWDARDAVEVYVHTENGSDTSYANAITAQQYVVGIKASDNTSVWTSMGGANAFWDTTGEDFSGFGLAKGSVDGQWLYYEFELTPFTYFGGVAAGDLSTSVATQLTEGAVVGFDVCIVGNDGNYTGMKSENMKIGKGGDWRQFGLHTLAAATAEPLAGDANNDGAVDVGDLGILAANYGTTSGASWSQGDFNGDGAVDVGDLGILAANYGSGSSSAADFDADYAKVFGEDADEVDESSVCGWLGLPLIAGLMLIGLMLVKLED